MLQVGVDSVNELGDTVDGQPFELPFVEFTEEAFHDVGPGGSSGDEVEVDPGISGQPVPDFFVLVCGVVVEDDVDFEIGIDAAFDGLDELQGDRTQDSRTRRSPRRSRNFLVVIAMDTNIRIDGLVG